MTNNKTEGVAQTPKEMWGIGWDAAITLGNNTAVQISDEYNNDDYIEQAHAASQVAERIRQYYGDRSYFPEDFPPSPPAGVEQRAKEYADKYAPVKPYEMYESDYDHRTQVAKNKEIQDHFIAGSESQGQQAVEFAEWVRNEGWEPAPKEFKSWYRKLVASRLEKKTTEQLYSMFRLNPPPASPE